MEGAWHSTSKINLSRQRVDRLFYFTSVDIETPPVSDAPDQVDVNINVTERPTGAVMFGAGFSDREGLILNGSISQDNIFWHRESFQFAGEYGADQPCFLGIVY